MLVAIIYPEQRGFFLLFSKRNPPREYFFITIGRTTTHSGPVLCGSNNNTPQNFPLKMPPHYNPQ